jgi:hypothetical protein
VLTSRLWRAGGQFLSVGCAVHQWGWTLTLHADATITARSPDRTRTLHSHGPPTRAA